MPPPPPLASITVTTSMTMPTPGRAFPPPPEPRATVLSLHRSPRRITLDTLCASMGEQFSFSRGAVVSRPPLFARRQRHPQPCHGVHACRASSHRCSLPVALSGEPTHDRHTHTPHHQSGTVRTAALNQHPVNALTHDATHMTRLVSHPVIRRRPDRSLGWCSACFPIIPCLTTAAPQ